MLRVFVSIILGQGPGNERTSMGNVAIAEELARIDELEQLYKLSASESEPETEGEDTEGAETGGMPHDPEPGVMPAAEPEGMPHD
jgi:hypothetical protein